MNMMVFHIFIVFSHLLKRHLKLKPNIFKLKKYKSLYRISCIVGSQPFLF